MNIRKLSYGFHFLDDLRKSGRIGHGEISENLAVDLDVRLGEKVDELAVTDALFTRSGIETGDPQRAEITLLVTAVSVSVFTGMGDGFDREAKVRLATAIVALDGIEDILTAFAGSDSIL